jgi:hypothetical protein
MLVAPHRDIGAVESVHAAPEPHQFRFGPVMGAPMAVWSRLAFGVIASALVLGSGCGGTDAESARPADSRSPLSPGTSSAALQATNRDEGATVTEREEYPDPNAPGTSAKVFVDPESIDGGLFRTAEYFTGPIRNENSLAERREAISARYSRGIPELKRQIEQLKIDTPPTPSQARERLGLWRSLAYLHLYEGKLAEASAAMQKAVEFSQSPGKLLQDRMQLEALLGIIALRRGEVANCLECLGPTSCIFPIAGDAIHTQPAGSREAIKHFTAYLESAPGDLRVRWLLNLAYMTLGEHPARVPPRYLIPLDRFRSKLDVGRFQNVAPKVGLTKNGPTQAGGCIFDDFDGDGLPDLLTTSNDPDQAVCLYRNRGDGTFEDRSAAAGLSEQVYTLNVTRADFDNDGNLDVLLLRGGWQAPAPLTLLRNKGGGVFEDVTARSGLSELIASESAAWGDYDNDGHVDLFVCGEYRATSGDSSAAGLEPRNFCRLYHNRGDGTFVDVAVQAGVTNERAAKGAVWGDYDDDGYLDLYVANLQTGTIAMNRLYHNEHDGTFRDVAVELGVSAPIASFPCLFWDFDNDGRLDIFVNDYTSSMAEVVGAYLGLPVNPAHLPRLYRNLGAEGFRDVSREVGLDRPVAAMSVNCGDIDNDGYLDLYCGTGWMSYSGLIPNVMLKNVDGKRFEDVTDSTGTGHLQKGHGVSFADWDCDGDLDFYSVLGGGCPGDRGYSVLFQNPGHGRHWLKIKLVGTRTNRAALGAKIRVDVKGPDGASRSIYRMVGTNGTFGGNSLVESIGLLDAKSVARLTITWPTSRTSQTFEDIAADQLIQITEGADSIKALPQTPFPVPQP